MRCEARMGHTGWHFKKWIGVCRNINTEKGNVCYRDIKLIWRIKRDIEVHELERKCETISGGNLNTKIRSLKIILLIQGLGN